MIISELINILKEYKDNHGDIEVYAGASIFRGSININSPRVVYSEKNNRVIIKYTLEN